MTIDMSIEKLNTLIKSLPGEVDLTKSNVVTSEMRYGLAQAYAIKGFREYMELAIRTANDSLDEVITLNDLAYVKASKAKLKVLYSLTKKMFEENEKIKNLSSLS